ncbi:hypothetical protein CEUSTIGMA_g4003.t1 [Chlamydomonas eustigma]|uniref:Uncharacterized protein n=1 Tax=Chlamydomonas eustigma TaxID=1157962 RepID=A0A250X0F7_9CHLO|nr:hypothetical protein CEUSTIGMA_g4003.t1 [Chlamydomonas eustigma]|eukprot:GAX76557.1 hypothetical protein CEUSTIGMA_g4003.t1 [Chlamydomonas eustigma]
MTSLTRDVSSEIRTLCTRCISHAQELLAPRHFIDPKITAVHLSSLTHALNNIISWWRPALVDGDSLSKAVADSRSLSEEDWRFLLDSKLILLIGDVLSIYRAPRHKKYPLLSLHDEAGESPEGENHHIFVERHVSEEDSDDINIVDSHTQNSEHTSRRTSWSSGSSHPGREEGLPYTAPQLPPAQSAMLEFATVVIKAVNKSLVPTRLYSRIVGQLLHTQHPGFILLIADLLVFMVREAKGVEQGHGLPDPRHMLEADQPGMRVVSLVKMLMDAACTLSLRVTERQRTDEFLQSLQPSLTILSTLVHTTGALGALVNLYGRAVSLFPSSSVDSQSSVNQQLQPVEEAIAALAAGLARAASAAGGDTSQNVTGIALDVSALEKAGDWGQSILEQARKGRGKKLVQERVMDFALLRLHEIIPDIEKEVGIVDSEQVFMGVNTTPPPPPYSLLPFQLRSSLDELCHLLETLIVVEAANISRKQLELCVLDVLKACMVFSRFSACDPIFYCRAIDCTICSLRCLSRRLVLEVSQVRQNEADRPLLSRTLSLEISDGLFQQGSTYATSVAGSPVHRKQGRAPMINALPLLENLCITTSSLLVDMTKALTSKGSAYLLTQHLAMYDDVACSLISCRYMLLMPIGLNLCKLIGG